MKKIFIQSFALFLFIIVSNISFASTNNAVVEIINHRLYPSYYSPWLPASNESGAGGSGFILKDRKIITNAHVAEASAFLTVRLASDTEKYVGRVEHIDHECDLAILSVADEDFWSKASYLEIDAKLPSSRDKVYMMGFSTGGNELAVTEGIISRAEMRAYVASEYTTTLLTLHIDANVWSGNSGGPAISSDTGKVVGVVHQGTGAADGNGPINYLIPAQVLEHMLVDYNSGKNKGFPNSKFIHSQRMDNPDIREYYKLPKGKSGILIISISPLMKDKTSLQKADVITEIDGYKISNDGFIELENGNRVNCNYVFTKKYIGDTVNFKVIRKGVEQSAWAKMSYKTSDYDLVPFISPKSKPQYYFYGGFVFAPLSLNYLFTYENWWCNAPNTLKMKFQYGKKEKNDDQVVVVSRVLSNSYTRGYKAAEGLIIKSVNGYDIRNLKDLENALKVNKEDFHNIITEHNNEIRIKRLRDIENKTYSEVFGFEKTKYLGN